jgi:hypothetical protein
MGAANLCTQKTFSPIRKNRKSYKSYHHSHEMPFGLAKIDSRKIGRLSDVPEQCRGERYDVFQINGSYNMQIVFTTG